MSPVRQTHLDFGWLQERFAKTRGSDDKWHNLVYGSGIVIQPIGWVDVQSGVQFNTCLLLSGWEIDDVLQVVYDGQIVDPSDYTLYITGENVSDATKYDYLPTVSLLSINVDGIGPGNDENFASRCYVRINGIKHYAYDSSGNKLASGSLNAQGGNNPDTTGVGNGKACGHQISALSPGVVTNPVWVAAHVLMNEFGVLHSSIDWASWSAMAAWCEDPEWAGVTPNNGFNLKININQRMSIQEAMGKILPPSMHMFHSQGLLKLGRVWETTNSNYVEHFAFTADDITQDSFEVVQTDPYSIPTDFTVLYHFEGVDASGRYGNYQLKRKFEFTEPADKYGKRTTQEIDLSHFVDADDIGSTDSLPLAESLLFMRRLVLGIEVFRFRVHNLEALMAEPGDQITFTYTHAGKTFTDQPAVIESIEVDESANSLGVFISARIHDDDWYTPDANAIVDTTLSVSTPLPDYFPAYRFSTRTGSSGANMRLNMLSGADVDVRAVRAGMQVWQYISGSPSTEADWANPNKWEWMGQVQSAAPDATNTYIAVTLTATAAQGYTTGNRVQIQPYCSLSNGSKYGQVQGYTATFNYPVPAWSWVGDYRAELSTGLGSSPWDETSGDWVDWPGSYSYELTSTGRYGYGGGTVDVPYREDGYSINPGQPDQFPLSIRFRLLNKLGQAPSSGTKYMYCFADDVRINKSVSKVSLTSQSAEVGSDWTEVGGLLFMTDWTHSTHSQHVSFDIRYSASPISSDAAFTAATQIYNGPAMRTVVLADTTAANIKTQRYFALKTRNASGEYTQTSGVDNLSSIQMTKVSRMFDKYTGAVNKTTYPGGGFLLATTEWLNYSPNWQNNDPMSGSSFMGGLYVYGPHAPTSAYDVTKWRRWSSRTSASPYWEPNGPTHAFEVNGDAKLSHYVQTSAGLPTVHSNEQGCHFYTLRTEPSFQALAGEYLFGLGKLNRYRRHVTKESAYKITNAIDLATGDGTFDSYRGAPLVVRRSFDVSRPSGFDVYINGAVAANFGITSNWGEGDVSAGIIDGSGANTRVFAVMDKAQFANSDNALASYSDGYWHTYSYVKDGVLVLDDYRGGISTNGTTSNVISVKLRNTSGAFETRKVYVSPGSLCNGSLYLSSTIAESSIQSSNAFPGLFYWLKDGTNYYLKVYLNSAWRTVATFT